MDYSKLIEFLNRLIRGSKRKIFVLVDNLSVYKSSKVKECFKADSEGIEAFCLPSYSPDLNPDEYLN
ncbi:MAG: transposase [Candidatus Melainabacteria bacterium]|jgi:transposase